MQNKREILIKEQKERMKNGIKNKEVSQNGQKCPFKNWSQMDIAE